MADRLDDLEVFIQAARLGSLTAAARALSISTTAASRRLSALEERLGVCLLERTTRHLNLTAAGQLYLHEGSAILTALDAVEAGLREPSGATPQPLRVVSVPGLLDAVLHDFLREHPALSLQILSPNAAQDVDVMVRIGEADAVAAAAAGEVHHVLAPCRWVACATAAWHAAHPEGLAPEDGIRVCGAPAMWVLQQGGEQRSLGLAGRLEVPDLAAARAAVLAGLGFAVLPALLVTAPLVPILPGWEAASSVIAACPLRALLRPEVRVLIDFLAERLR